jgi:hypothetical protein
LLGPALAAEYRITGLPALLIMLVLLAIFIVGVVAIVRFVGRRARGR